MKAPHTVPPFVDNRSRSAVFLDRDGVIVENRAGYITRWEQVSFLPGAVEALRTLSDADFRVVVVTNQAAVSKGLMSYDEAAALNLRVLGVIEQMGGRVDASYLCPHGAADGCNCRKPLPGMLLAAASDLGIDLTRSWMIGDALTDVQAAQAASVRPILVRTGRGESQLRDSRDPLPPNLPVVAGIADAVSYLLAADSRLGPGAIASRSDVPAKVTGGAV